MTTTRKVRLGEQTQGQIPSDQLADGTDTAGNVPVANGDGTQTWGAGGSGAPTTADYLVGTAQGGLSAEIVVGATPGGELGGTWAAPTVDATHSGSTHSASTDTHIADTSAAHAAAAIDFDDTGLGITAADVQEMGEQLDAAISAGGIPATIVDAKGDLIVATAADTVARLAALANGAALVTASGESSGLKWRLNNDAASAAPAVTDDSGDGYSIGSRWLDTTADKEYVALDVTAGAAVWVETTGGGGSLGAWTSFTPTLTGTTTNPTLGSSTLVGRYKVMDSGLTMLYIVLTVTTGGAWNAGSGNWNFGNFPVTSVASRLQTFHGFLHDAGTGIYTCGARVAGGTTTTSHLFAADAAGGRIISNTVPVTWATGDELVMQGYLET